MPKVRKKLGELLVEAGVLDPLQLQSALGRQRQWGGRLGAVLVQAGFVTEQQLLDILSSHLKVPVVNLASAKVDPRAVRLLPAAVAEQMAVFPLELKGSGKSEVLVVAMTDPTDLAAVDQLQFRTRKRIAALLAGTTDIEGAIRVHYYRETPAPPVREQAPAWQGAVPAPGDPTDPFAGAQILDGGDDLVPGLVAWAGDRDEGAPVAPPPGMEATAPPDPLFGEVPVVDAPSPFSTGPLGASLQLDLDGHSAIPGPAPGAAPAGATPAVVDAVDPFAAHAPPPPAGGPAPVGADPLAELDALVASPAIQMAPAVVPQPIPEVPPGLGSEDPSRTTLRNPFLAPPKTNPGVQRANPAPEPRADAPWDADDEPPFPVPGDRGSGAPRAAEENIEELEVLELEEAATEDGLASSEGDFAHPDWATPSEEAQADGAQTPEQDEHWQTPVETREDSGGTGATAATGRPAQGPPAATRAKQGSSAAAGTAMTARPSSPRMPAPRVPTPPRGAAPAPPKTASATPPVRPAAAKAPPGPPSVRVALPPAPAPGPEASAMAPPAKSPSAAGRRDGTPAPATSRSAALEKTRPTSAPVPAGRTAGAESALLGALLELLVRKGVLSAAEVAALRAHERKPG